MGYMHNDTQLCFSVKSEPALLHPAHTASIGNNEVFTRSLHDAHIVFLLNTLLMFGEILPQRYESRRGLTG